MSTQPFPKSLIISMSFNTTKIPFQIFPYQFTLNFYLRDNQSTKPTDIVYVIRFFGCRINLTRGVKVIPSQWNKREQRALISYKFAEINNIANQRVNQRLEEDLAAFDNLVYNVCTNPTEILNFEKNIRDTFMPRRKKTVTSDITTDIFKIMHDAIINNSTINERTQENYIKKGLKALKSYSNFRKLHGDPEIDSFAQLNADIIDGFAEYLKSGQYLQPNGQPYAMSSLNSIIKYAVSAIKCTPSSYLPKSQAQLITTPQLTDKTADNNEIALTDSEVIKLWKYKPKDNSDQMILDMFLLECTSGQRISDIPKIGEGIQNRDGILYITIVQDKTSKKVEVPIIFEIAEIILSKYPDGLPKIDKDKINKNIKRLAKNAGITGTETVSRHYSGADKPVVTAHERADLISSHTGRRTFVSLLSTRGWNYEEIAKYTGHTNIKTVQGYDKSTAIDREAFKKLKPEEKVRMLSDMETPHPAATTEAKTALDVLLKAAKQLGYELGRTKGGAESLLNLSKYFEQQKQKIISSDGMDEYYKIREALQFGATVQEQELLNKFFAMNSLKWKNRPLHFIHFEEAQSFWEKIKLREDLEGESRDNKLY